MKEELGFVAALIAQAGVDYAVIGGHAVNAWLEPRFTADIDVTIVAAPVQLEQLTEVFEKEGLSMSEQHGAELVSGPDFVRFATSDATVVVELQLAKTALQASVVSRAKVTPGGVRVASPEDLLVLKLIADRAKDRLDLQGLARLPGLDWSYVEQQCRDWDVLDRLERLRHDRATD